MDNEARGIDREYLTLASAAEFADTPVPTLRHWISRGKLKGYRPGRRVLVEKRDLVRFLRSRGTGRKVEQPLERTPDCGES
jgi:excisionase family DNA binding protein